MIVEEVTEAGWHVVDDSTIMKQILSTAPNGDTVYKSVDSGRDVPTVREVLEWVYPVVVMDTESAVEGSEYLERQMDSVQEFRDRIAEMSLERSKTGTTPAPGGMGMVYDAYYALDKIAFPNNETGIDSLNDPTDPDGFLYRGVVYEQVLHKDLTGSGVDEKTDAEIKAEAEAEALYQAEKLRKHTEAAASLHDDPMILNKEGELPVRKPIIPIIITIKGL